MDQKQNGLIHVPLNGNSLLEKVVTLVNADVEVATLWRVINVNAIERMQMSDHGPVHFQIVANIALRLCRLLAKKKIEMSICKNYDLSPDYAELVVFLASLFHDLGMTVSRDGHEEFSIVLANGVLHRLLDFLPLDEKTIVTSEVLHAIISHRSDGRPLTIEAGIVRVADALDMSQGRSRISYQAGNLDIHSVSAYAIDGVEIQEGTDKPIQITITMNNSAGIFQIDDLLKSKIKGSGLENLLDVKAFVREGPEASLIKEYFINKKPTA